MPHIWGMWSEVLLWALYLLHYQSNYLSDNYYQRERCFPQQTRLRILHHQVVIKEPQKLTETKGQGAQLKTQISPYLLWNPWLEQGCGWVVPSLIEVFSTVWWWDIHFNCFNNWASKWNSLSDFQPLCLWAFQATSPCPQFDFPHQRRRKV